MNTSRTIQRVLNGGITKADFTGPEGEVTLLLGVNRKVMGTIYDVVDTMANKQLVDFLEAHMRDHIEEDSHAAVKEDFEMNFLGNAITDHVQVRETVVILLSTIILNRVFNLVTAS